MSNKKAIAQEWFNKGKHDIEGARLLFERGHYSDTIGMLIQQAIEKYLKGFLLFHDWRLKKTHDLEELLTEVIEYDSTFKQYLDFARTATGYYIEARYPPGPPIDYSTEEIEEALSIAEELISKIEEAIK